MRYSLLYIALLVLTIPVSAQSLEEREQRLSNLFIQLNKSKSDAITDSLDAAIRQEWKDCFTDPACFSYPFESVRCCKLIASDQRVRLINWNIGHFDGTFRYSCFVLVKEPKSDQFRVVELTPLVAENPKLKSKVFTEDKWPGALYYEIIPMDKKGKSMQYTLVGWDGKDNLTNRKFVECMTVTDSNIKFGGEIFSAVDSQAKRLIYEYGESATASIKYYPKKGCIVMDHLSPSHDAMTGYYSEYGPDGTYDALLLKDGEWTYEERVDASQFTSDDGKPYKKPKKK